MGKSLVSPRHGCGSYVCTLRPPTPRAGSIHSHMLSLVRRYSGGYFRSDLDLHNVPHFSGRWSWPVFWNPTGWLLTDARRTIGWSTLPNSPSPTMRRKGSTSGPTCGQPATARRVAWGTPRSGYTSWASPNLISLSTLKSKQRSKYTAAQIMGVCR